MTALPVVERMKPRGVGVETWMRVQYAGRDLPGAIREYPSDYHSAPGVGADECMDTVELFYASDYSVCNYKCPYCYVGWAPDERKNWDTRDLFPKLMYRLSQLRHRLRLNMENLGEWFTNKALIEGTVFLARRENVSSISITTNASMLDRMIPFLDAVDVGKISFTCTYHATEVTLDDYLRNITVLRDHGANVVIATVVFPDNLAHCIELKHRAEALGVHFRVNAAEQLWRDAEGVTDEQLRSFYELLEEHRRWDAQRKGRLLGLNETRGALCTAGQRYLWLNDFGDMFICASSQLYYKHTHKDSDLCLGNVFEIEGDRLPVRTEDLVCPFERCFCPKDVLRQSSHQSAFRISERTRHEVYFRDDAERAALLAKPPVVKL
jgi:MoaA/NifB/PqqE/SkfB family radical SAM enzyme